MSFVHPGLGYNLELHAKYSLEILALALHYLDLQGCIFLVFLRLHISVVPE